MPSRKPTPKTAAAQQPVAPAVTHSLTVPELPAHNHAVVDASHTHSVSPMPDRSGHLHPPVGVKTTAVGHTGHTHAEPTDCASCAETLQREGWATPAQHARRREQEIEERLKKAERARILGLDLPL